MFRLIKISESEARHRSDDVQQVEISPSACLACTNDILDTHENQLLLPIEEQEISRIENNDSIYDWVESSNNDFDLWFAAQSDQTIKNVYNNTFTDEEISE